MNKHNTLRNSQSRDYVTSKIITIASNIPEHEKCASIVKTIELSTKNMCQAFSHAFLI